MVGERGFEPPTPWSRNSNRCAKLLIRLGRWCVYLGPNAWFSAAIGPKLDPSFVGLYGDHSVLKLGMAGNHRSRTLGRPEPAENEQIPGISLSKKKNLLGDVLGIARFSAIKHFHLCELVICDCQ